MSNEQNQIVDLDDLSLEEIRRLANEEGQQPKEAAEPTEQSRDEKGRFVKAEEEVEPEPEQTVFRREIDLGEGSGVQVFQAESLELLVDKLADAQRNATKKIREQAERLKQMETARQKETVEQTQFSDDEEFILSQELMSRPTKAINAAFKKMTGYDITEFKSVADRAKAWEAAQQQQTDVKKQDEAANTFVAAHPEYMANQRNGARLVKTVNILVANAKVQGQEADYSSLLEQAYRDLTESGLLEIKSEDDVTAEEEPAGTVQRRIVETVEEAPVQRKKASGLSTRGRVIATVKNTEPTLDELYDMPLDKLKELANRSMN